MNIILSKEEQGLWFRACMMLHQLEKDDAFTIICNRADDYILALRARQGRVEPEVMSEKEYKCMPVFPAPQETISESGSAYGAPDPGHQDSYGDEEFPELAVKLLVAEEIANMLMDQAKKVGTLPLFVRKGMEAAAEFVRKIY